MANLLNKIPTNLTEYPNSFKRQGAFPLEAYSIFYNTIQEQSGGGSIEKTALQMAQDYAKNNPIAYIGQILTTVSDEADGPIIDLYQIINENGDLVKIINEDIFNYQMDLVKNNLNTLKGDTDTSLELLEKKHNEYEENINSQLEKISEGIASRTHFSVQLVSAVNVDSNEIKLIGTDTFIDAEYSVIYLLKDTSAVGEDIYKEYILVQQVKSSGDSEEYKLTLTGTTSTDLSDYAKTSDLELLQALQESINNEVTEEDLSKDYIITFNATEGEDKGKIKVKKLENSISTLLNLQNVINSADKTKQYAIGYVEGTGTVQLQEISLDDGVWGEE